MPVFFFTNYCKLSSCLAVAILVRSILQIPKTSQSQQTQVLLRPFHRSARSSSADGAALSRFKRKKSLVLCFSGQHEQTVLKLKQLLIFHVNTFMTSLQTPSADKNCSKKSSKSPNTLSLSPASAIHAHDQFASILEFPLMDKRWRRKWKKV